MHPRNVCCRPNPAPLPPVAPLHMHVTCCDPVYWTWELTRSSKTARQGFVFTNSLSSGKLTDSQGAVRTPTQHNTHVCTCLPGCGGVGYHVSHTLAAFHNLPQSSESTATYCEGCWVHQQNKTLALHVPCPCSIIQPRHHHLHTQQHATQGAGASKTTLNHTTRGGRMSFAVGACVAATTPDPGNLAHSVSTCCKVQAHDHTQGCNCRTCVRGTVHQRLRTTGWPLPAKLCR